MAEVTLTDTLLDLEGNPARANISFILTATLYDETTNTVYAPEKRVESLDGSGTYSVTLPATVGDNLRPTGVTYRIQISVEGQPPQTFEIELDPSLGATQHLSTIAPVTNRQLFQYALNSALNAHVVDTLAVHGIADTAQLATLADLAANVPVWGNVSGTLSAQTDLAAALAGKQASLGYTPLAPANNLSDVTDAVTARTNLGAQSNLGFVNAGESPNPAIGDGVTDTTTRLQAKLDAAIAAKVPLYIPPGIYLTGALSASAPVTIGGAGIAGEEKTAGTTILKARTAGQTLLTLGAAGTATGNYHSQLTNLVLDGANLATTGLDLADWDGVGLILDTVMIRNCTTIGVDVGAGIHAFLLDWRNVSIRNCVTGANLLGYVQASTFYKCHFVDNDTVGVKLAGSALQFNDNNAISFVGCTFEQPAGAVGSSGLSVDSCETVALDGCYFELIGSSSAAAITLVDTLHPVNLRASGCYFNGGGVGATAIHVPSTARTNGIWLTLEDCNVSNYSTGVVDHANVSGIAIRAHLTGENAATLRSENRGSVTLAAGASSVVVSHGCYTIPGIITVQPTGDMTPATRCWVSAITATQFTLHSNTALTNDTLFLWSADASLPGTAIGDTLLSAKFTAADGTLLSAYTPDIGPAFTVLAGAPAITSNALHAGSSSAEQATANVSKTDVTVQANLTFHTGNAAKLVARASDANNQIRGGLTTSGAFNLTKVIAGTETVIVSGGGTSRTDGQVSAFKLVCSGTTVELWVDGVLQRTGTVTELATNTNVGVYFSGGTTSRIDDVIVTNP